jgi:hypothetical protein
MNVPAAQMALLGTTSLSSDAAVHRKFLTMLAEMVGRVPTTFSAQLIDFTTNKKRKFLGGP